MKSESFLLYVWGPVCCLFVPLIFASVMIAQEAPKGATVAASAAFKTVAPGKPDADDKVTEFDTVRARRVVIKSEDGLSDVVISRAGKGVGIWVSSKGHTVCIAAGVAGDGKPYLGTWPAYNTAEGCPLAISSDGTIQLAVKKSVKHLTVEQLFRFAK